MYEYKAKLVRVIDGDTFIFDVDLGFGIRFEERFRLYGVDTPEIYGRNASPEGKIVKGIVERIFAWNGPEFIIHTFKDKKGKYGRYLVDVQITHDENGQELLTELNKEEGTTALLSSYLVLNGMAEDV